MAKDKKEEPLDIQKLLAVLKRTTMQNFANGLPPGIGALSCNQCDGPLLGVYNSNLKEFGMWCAECNRGGAIDNAVALKDGDFIAPEINDDIDEKSPLHPLHGN